MGRKRKEMLLPRRRVDWGLGGGLWAIGRTARPRTAAAARIRCSRPDSVARRVCRAPPRRAPGIWQAVGISCLRVNTVGRVWWFGSVSAGGCIGPCLVHLKIKKFFKILK